jgi:hypothetical protein
VLKLAQKGKKSIDASSEKSSVNITCGHSLIENGAVNSYLLVAQRCWGWGVWNLKEET